MGNIIVIFLKWILNNFFDTVELDLGVNPKGETWVKFVTKGRTHV